MEKCPYGVVIPITLGEHYSAFVPPWHDGVRVLFGSHRKRTVTSEPHEDFRTIIDTAECPGALTMVTRPFVEGSRVLTLECKSCSLHYQTSSWTEDSLNSALTVWLCAGLQGSTGALVQAPFVRLESGPELACFETGADTLVNGTMKGGVMLGLCHDAYHVCAGANAMAYLAQQFADATQDTAQLIARLRGFRSFPAPK